MKHAITAIAVLFVFGGLISTPTVVSAGDDNQGVFCSLFGWLVEPIGLCQPVNITVYTDDEDAVSLVKASNLALATAATSSVTDRVFNEHLSVQTNGISEAELDDRINDIIAYINARPTTISNQYSFTRNLNEPASKEYVVRSTGRSSDQISRSAESITEEGEFTSPTMTNAVMSGTSYATGLFGVGTTTPSEVLTVDGSVYLSQTSPSVSNNRLYNFGGDLYWNGSIVTASTSGNWTAGSGDVFRLTGGVGVGTSTFGQSLAVDGTAIFTGTTTAPIVDTGGQVCDVRAYGAVGDNSTLNDAAIAAAIADCGDGGTVFFPMGEFRIASPIVLDKPVTLRGSYSPRWSYSSTPRSSIRADFGSFSGVAMIHVRDRTISGETADNNGGRLEHITLDGGSASTDVDGIYFEGLVRDWKLTDVDISQVTGNGFEAAVGTGSGNPRGFTIRGLSIYSADGHGFRATALNDTFIDDLLSVGNALRGIYLSSMGETKIANSRAVFNGLTGLYIDGSSNNGGLSFTDFSTDRNDRHGVRIAASGTSTIIFNGLVTRRDGPNTSAGSETPYAGLAIIGSSTEKVAPVFVSGLGQVVGVDDFDNPPLSPDTGVRVTNATYVKIDGQLWGVTEAWRDDGGNDNFIIEDDSILKTGTAGAQELFSSNRKWQATTTGLYYGDGVSIGSTTGSRLLNVTAPDEAGMRIQDTTNDVIFDVRAEDFQGFLGTFSNHQLRFQTNNASRLTIDTNGDIGIGTTTPDSELDVIGTIQSSDLLGGAVNLTTDVNGNIIRDPSDLRLKTNIVEIDNSLERILALRGVTYEWKDKDRFGDQVEVGFIAQEVDEVVPEVVRKGGDYWSLNTRNLVAVVVEAMQEMWDTVTGNQDKIETLEERIETLEDLLDVEYEQPEENEETQEVEELEVEEESTATTTDEVAEPEEETASSTDGVVEEEEKESTEETIEEESEESEDVPESNEEEVEIEEIKEEEETPEEVITDDSEERESL